MSNKIYDIIGVGDADIDIMIEVDHIPGHDEKVLGKVLGKYPGGMVANFLAAAATFGARCAGILCVGDDDFGKITLEDLRKRGVNTDKSVIREGQDTYFTATNLDASGEKSMTIALTDATYPTADEVDFDFLEKAEFVQMVGTYPDLVIPVGRQAKTRGVKLSLDFEPESQDMTQQQKDETLALSYIVFPNEDGLKCYVGYDDVEKGAREMLSKGPEIVVVTKGAKGCEVFTNDDRFEIPAFKVDVKDTTGAGDTFNASFLACLAKGYPLRECAWLATASAACQVTAIGSRTNLITEAQAREFLNFYPIPQKV